MSSLPQFHRGAAGYYTATATDSHGETLCITVEHTDVETHQMYGVHGWFWRVDGLGERFQSEIAWLTKRDAERELAASWADICA